MCPFPPPSERTATLGHSRAASNLRPHMVSFEGALDLSPPSGDCIRVWASFLVHLPILYLAASLPEGAEEPTGGARRTTGVGVSLFPPTESCGPQQTLSKQTFMMEALIPGPRPPSVASAMGGGGVGTPIHLEPRVLLELHYGQVALGGVKTLVGGFCPVEGARGTPLCSELRTGF